MVILEIDFKSLNDEIVNSCLPQMLKESKKRELQTRRSSSRFREVLEREREQLLSRNADDPTVGGLRGEKEKRSTRGKLRVDSGIGSFFKLLEVGFSPYLSFYSHLNVLLMFRLNEAVRVSLIGPKTWDRIIGNFFRNF